MKTLSIPRSTHSIFFPDNRPSAWRAVLLLITSSMAAVMAPAQSQNGFAKFILSDGLPHLVSIDARSHVVELFFQNQRWAYNDLTKASRATLPAAKTNLSSFILSDGMPHIAFIDINQHVVQVFYQDHRWIFNDLTASSHAPPVSFGTKLTSFVLPDGLPRIAFIDGHRHVGQLLYRDNKWVFSDMTASCGAPAAAHGSALINFVLVDGVPHIISVDEHKHLIELFYRDQKWAFNDISAKSGAPDAEPEGGLTSFILGDGFPHVVSVDVHQHVIELLFQNQRWVSNDLSSGANAPDVSSGSQLTDFVLPNGLPHIGFIDGHHHIQELFFANHKWLRNDLTASSRAPTAEPQSGLISFVLGDGFPHVIFKDGRQHANELFFQNSKWLCNDLTASVVALK